MALIRSGVVVGKDFRPPDGADPVDWCFLVVDVSEEERVTVRLHRDKLSSAGIGDRITFSSPVRRNGKVRFVKRS